MDTLTRTTTNASAATPAPALAGVEDRALTLRWPDGATHRFDAVWLRDNARGDAYRHGGNDQRLFDVADLPADITIAAAEIAADGNLRLTVEPEGLDLVFSPTWLRANAYDGRSGAGGNEDGEGAAPATWDARLAERLVRHDYAAVTRDPAALYDWLDAIRVDGFALMQNVPAEPGMVCRLASLFGFVRETNYGRLFDVRSEARPNNMAFTATGLGVHTDNPYRDPVPGLQLLHCLAAEEDGGASIVVDGFEAARRLAESAPEDFALLTRWRVPFRYRTGTTDLRARRQLIEVDEAGRPIAVAYNNRSIAPLDLPAEVMPAYYRAYRRFSEVLRDPSLAVRFKMGPGELFVVDNRRVLHGRDGFAGGTRHLQGCYADTDSLLSQLRVMERERGDEGEWA